MWAMPCRNFRNSIDSVRSCGNHQRIPATLNETFPCYQVRAIRSLFHLDVSAPMVLGSKDSESRPRGWRGLGSHDVVLLICQHHVLGSLDYLYMPSYPGAPNSPKYRRSCLYTLGPKVGSIYILGALGIMRTYKTAAMVVNGVAGIKSYSMLSLDKERTKRRATALPPRRRSQFVTCARRVHVPKYRLHS